MRPSTFGLTGGFPDSAIVLDRVAVSMKDRSDQPTRRQLESLGVFPLAREASVNSGRTANGNLRALPFLVVSGSKRTVPAFQSMCFHCKRRSDEIRNTESPEVANVETWRGGSLEGLEGNQELLWRN